MADSPIGEWQARIRKAAAARTPLRLCGGGTKDFYGQALCGAVLDTRAHAGIVAYDPGELVLSARAGTPLDEIEAAMLDAGQMLAFEPPHFGSGATLGGCLATGLSGPRRPFSGSARDVVLGVRILDGKGDDLLFGGRVMKNVAGFDVARLMIGALGTLGLLLEVSIKCAPRPKSESTRLFDCSADEAIRWTNDWGGKPLPLSATCYYGGKLAIRLSGAAPAVEAAERKLGGSALSDGTAFWQSVREQTHSFFAASVASGASLWRLSVKPSAAYTDLGGEQMVEWGGALRWLVAGKDTVASRVRAWAQENGGHATLFRSRDKAAGAFHPLPEPLVAVHARLKKTFDPAGVLNSGRLYPQF
jgi:glycolate oxidase FAD binding subunit